MKFNKEEVMKILEGAKDEQGNVPFAIVKKAIEKLKVEPEWIPCSGGLPEQYGNYLVSYRTDDFESDIGTFDPDRINSDTGEWSACDANGFYWVASKGLEVIAWMPLPKPYRAESENK